MHPETHRAALLAAARLALTAAVPAMVVACSAGSNPSARSTTQADDTNPGTTDNTPACVADYCAGADPDVDVVTCCQDEVAGATFPTPLHLGPNPDPQVDDVTQGCCTVLATSLAHSDFTSIRMECCDAIGWNAAATCTPWGPPVPPAMPRARAVA